MFRLLFSISLCVCCSCRVFWNCSGDSVVSCLKCRCSVDGFMWVSVVSLLMGSGLV